MYLWIGLGIEKTEEKRIRAYCRQENREGADESAFLLPQHISLKCSFPTEHWEAIIGDLKNCFRQLPGFTLEAEALQQIPGILWLRIRETPALRDLHNALNDRLLQKFSIGLSGFDGDDFAFHSTLFQDPAHPEKIRSLFQRMGTVPFYSKEIPVDRIYFGISPSGKAGTYQVVDSIALKEERRLP